MTTKLSDWIPDPRSPDSYMRILEGADLAEIKNRVAFIEKTPRVRVTPFTIVDDFKNWEQGYKGCGEELGRYQPSRDWCDQRLVELGYELPSTTTTEELYSQTCHDCKYLIREEITDTWVSVGECNFYCDNEKAIFEGYVEMLDPDCLEDYPKTCKGFAPKDIS